MLHLPSPCGSYRSLLCGRILIAVPPHSRLVHDSMFNGFLFSPHHSQHQKRLCLSKGTAIRLQTGPGCLPRRGPSVRADGWRCRRRCAPSSGRRCPGAGQSAPKRCRRRGRWPGSEPQGRQISDMFDCPERTPESGQVWSGFSERALIAQQAKRPRMSLVFGRAVDRIQCMSDGAEFSNCWAS